MMQSHNVGVVYRKISSLTKVLLQRRAIQTIKHDESHLYPTIPRPGHLRHVDLSHTRALLLSNVANGLSKRVQLQLQARGVIANLVEVESEAHIEQVTEEYAGTYDLIICPFLTKRIPKSVWQNKKTPCLIVHPGIVGDRGASSLDWAINGGHTRWGVTVLQAAEEMDAGDIWSSKTFPVDGADATKTRLYNGEVCDAAVAAVIDSVKRFKLGIAPMPLDYSDPDIQGRLQPNMKTSQRRVDWNAPADVIVKQIRKSDTQPGARACVGGLEDVVLFGGHLQRVDTVTRQLYAAKQPGDLIAERDGAVLVKAGDGECVWVTHMKRSPSKSSIKLPATMVLGPELGPLPLYEGPSSWQEIRTTHLEKGRISVIHFDFYNGAMSTSQCKRLENTISRIAQDPTVEVVVLLGGKGFFSTGIHLNVIEASPDPAEESWRNINAINDVIKAMLSIKNKIVVSAMQSGAGAGGVMMAAAADLVWARKGALLTPSYKAMHLHGSEYWTYFLPHRVGQTTAHNLTESGQSILSEDALQLGLVDDVFGSTSWEFCDLLSAYAWSLLYSPILGDLKNRKELERNDAWYETVEAHRTQELEHMKKCFISDDYIEARQKFVYH